MFANTSLGKGSHITKPEARVGSTTEFIGKGQELRYTQQVGTIFAITLHFLGFNWIESDCVPSILRSSKHQEPCLWIHVLDLGLSWSLSECYVDPCERDVPQPTSVGKCQETGMVIMWPSTKPETRLKSFHADNQCHEWWTFYLTSDELTQSTQNRWVAKQL